MYGLGCAVTKLDNGKENGNYYSIIGANIGVVEKNMETII